jgi:WD40 repeat protein
MGALGKDQWILAVWDAQTGERIRTLRGHKEAIHGFAYLPGGTLLSWARDGTLRLWDPDRGVIRSTCSLAESINATFN